MAVNTITSNLAGFQPLIGGGQKRAAEAGATKRANIAAAATTGAASIGAESRLKTAMIQSAAAERQAEGARRTAERGQDVQKDIATGSQETQKEISTENIKADAAKQLTINETQTGIADSHNEVERERMNFEDIWRGREYDLNEKELDLRIESEQNLAAARKALSFNNLLDSVLNYSVLTKLVEQEAGIEAGKEKRDIELSKLIEKDETDFNVKMRGRELVNTKVQEILEEPKIFEAYPEASVAIGKVMDSQNGLEFTPEMMTDSSLVATKIQEGGMGYLFGLLNSVDALEAGYKTKMAEAKEAGKGPGFLGRAKEIAFVDATSGAVRYSERKRAEQLETNLTRLSRFKNGVLTGLLNSDLPMPDNRTVGQNVTQAWARYDGDTVGRSSRELSADNMGYDDIVSDYLKGQGSRIFQLKLDGLDPAMAAKVQAIMPTDLLGRVDAKLGQDEIRRKIGFIGPQLPINTKQGIMNLGGLDLDLSGDRLK